jgi:DNA-binding CsgD family transcriptional regulator
MLRLLPSDCEKLLALTSHLCSIEESVCLPQQLLRGIQPLIPSEFAGCHLLQPSRHQIDACYEPERPPLPTQHKDFWRLAQDHPLHRVLFARPLKAWKLSDVMPRQAFHQTEFYNVLYRPLDVDCELVAALPDGELQGRFLLVSLHRHRTDFSERDRTLLNLLLPHVANARRRLCSHERTLPAGQWWFWDEKSFYDWICNRTRWGLSRRESQVLFWLCQGKSNAEIGSILGIAGRTAETHALRIYPKIGVENRYNAIATLNQLAATERR